MDKEPRNYRNFSWYARITVSERCKLQNPLDDLVCNFWDKGFFYDLVVISLQGAENVNVCKAFSPKKTIFKWRILPTAKKKPRNYGIFSWYATITVSERFTLSNPLDYRIRNSAGKLMENILN
ncbi:hypothetical protein M0802_014834 [Mischocyttarus mexicanus]|nr:hypothetical protein M0802_014841 [Mischocyttarus mexicanus]KAI4476695.1 hypothetical protein M0802_014834 [Mischocyttarus mexicanus]